MNINSPTMYFGQFPQRTRGDMRQQKEILKKVAENIIDKTFKFQGNW